MIELKVSETASRLLQRAWQQDVLRGVRWEMAYQNELTVGHIRKARMTGKGPFPVSQGRLGVRTNRLRNSLRATQPRIAGGTVVGSIGSNVVYAAAHEFGYRRIPARAPITRGIEDRKAQYEKAVSDAVVRVFETRGLR